MVTLKIDNKTVCVPEGTTILDAALSAGVHIPHLCYLKGINEIGACRLCCVEVAGEEKLIPACNNVVSEGMVVRTTNARVRRARRTNLQLILSRHDAKCALCVRSGNCELQTLANDLGLSENPFQETLPSEKLRRWDRTFPLIRDATKCIECMRCIQICDKVQSLNVWDLVATGSHTRVNVSDNRTIREADCSLCGQCITHCPVGALRERDDVQAVLRAIEDPNTVTVVQIAPAVRTAWGEAFGLEPEQATVNRLAGALRQVGFDYVFDTSYSADLTIMEESAEFLDRLGKGELEQYPMFTSCCPGWVRFVKSQFPQLVGQLSTAKSPQQMFGAVVKHWFARQIKTPPERICCVSVMPCVAKKAESALPTMKSPSGLPDVDYVLTTREVVRLLRAEHVQVALGAGDPLRPAAGRLQRRGRHIRRHRRRDGSRVAHRLLPRDRPQSPARFVPQRAGGPPGRQPGLAGSRVRDRGHHRPGGCGQRPRQCQGPVRGHPERGGEGPVRGDHGLPRRLCRGRRPAHPLRRHRAGPRARPGAVRVGPFERGAFQP